MAHVSLEEARKRLSGAKEPFVSLFTHGSLEAEYYKPDQVDHQSPHERDEVYVVVSGRGDFINGGERESVATGALLFVPAGQEHRFVDFTDDFAVWALFYGPKGGEGESLSKKDQMAAFEDALKEEDWGHQPC